MIIKFSLVNNLGQEFTMQNVETGFVTNVGGIGGKVNNSYMSLANTWVKMNSKNAQSEIKGDVVFHGSSAYTKESEFITFIRLADGLKFKAETPVTTKYIDVDVISYELTAIGPNTLLCPITMLATSLWYTNTSARAAIIASDEGEFRFPVTWAATFNDYSDGYMNVDNDGSTEASFEVEFYGTIDNPVISLEVEGTEVSKVEIDTSITSAQRILYSTKDGNICCFKGSSEAISEYKRSGSTTGLTNLALSFSLSNENFFKLPVGNSKLHITADSTLTNPIMVSIYKYYRAV